MMNKKRYIMLSRACTTTKDYVNYPITVPKTVQLLKVLCSIFLVICSEVRIISY